MSDVVNDRDVLLTTTVSRINAGGVGVIVVPSSPTIKFATDGTPNPSAVTFTATKLSVAGNLTWSIVGGTLTGTDPNVRTLTAANMTADSATVTVKVTYGGVEHSNSTTVHKVRDGVVSYTWIKYADTATGTGLSDDPTGKTYIGLAHNKTTATESTNPADYSWSLIKGTDGVPGAKGADGTTYYTWIKYSDNADGTGLYDVPTANTVYIGIATNKTTATESTVKTDYVWSRFRGSDGVAGTNGTNGSRGAGHYYATGSAWSNALADAVTPGGNVLDDVVTISNGTNFVMEKKWNGSAWVDMGVVIDGKLIVTESITSAQIDTRGLSIKDASGNVILAAGSALNPNYAAPGTKNSEATYSSFLTWDFRNSVDGWGPLYASLTALSDSMRVTSTASDPMIFSPNFSLNGGTYDKIRMKVRRTAGSAWDGALYYFNANHGDHGSYFCSINDTTVLNEWVILEWDMAKSTIPADWYGGTVTRLRIDLGASAADVFEIDWISVGKYAPAPSVTEVTSAATTANWVNVSNRPSDSDIRNNLIDLKDWRLNTRPNWTPNQEGNAIFPCAPAGTPYLTSSIPGPKGGSDLVWYCQEQSNNGEAGGGWDAPNTLALDPNRTYRFMIPIRRLTGSGSSYWGVQPNSVCSLNDTQPHGNPYFASAGLSTGKWYLLVGFIFPAGSVGNTHEGAGIYDCSTGALVVQGTNYCFNASYGGQTGHRAYQFYATHLAEQLFGRPMVNLVDGSEPPIREYFEASATLNSALTSTIADKLSKSSAGALGAIITLQTGGSILAGNTTNGVYMHQTGLVGVQNGAVKFSVPISGDPTFAGRLTAAYGDFGALRIASGGYIAQGAYTGSWSWPSASEGGGFLIHPNGMLFGNANNPSIGFIYIDAANGRMAMPGFDYNARQLTLDQPVIINPKTSTSFSATMAGVTQNGLANTSAYRTYSFQPTLSNGVGPYSYFYVFSPEAGDIKLTSSPTPSDGWAVVSARGSNQQALGYLTVTVTDANGSKATVTCRISLGFGAY